jgi:hypothetical protein
VLLPGTTTWRTLPARPRSPPPPSSLHPCTDAATSGHAAPARLSALHSAPHGPAIASPASRTLPSELAPSARGDLLRYRQLDRTGSSSYGRRPARSSWPSRRLRRRAQPWGGGRPSGWSRCFAGGLARGFPRPPPRALAAASRDAAAPRRRAGRTIATIRLALPRPARGFGLTALVDCQLGRCGRFAPAALRSADLLVTHRLPRRRGAAPLADRGAREAVVSRPSAPSPHRESRLPALAGPVLLLGTRRAISRQLRSMFGGGGGGRTSTCRAVLVGRDDVHSMPYGAPSTFIRRGARPAVGVPSTFVRSRRCARSPRTRATSSSTSPRDRPRLGTRP